MTEKTKEERVAGWKQTLEALNKQILTVHHHRQIWDLVNNTLPYQPDAGIAHEAFANWYAASQGAAIRRLADAKNISMRTLLESLRAHAEELTRSDYYELWPQLTEPDKDERGFFRKSADDAFDEFAGPGGEHLDPAIIDADLAALKSATEKIARWADENVAHIGRKQSVFPTFDDLNAAINFVGEMLQRYTLFLTAASLARVEPTIQGPWKTPFKGWIDTATDHEGTLDT